MTFCHAQTIARYHYWIDADKFHEQTEALPTHEKPIDINWSMALDDMTEGMHTLYYRVQDNEGEWSYLHSWDFFVKRIVTNETIEVTSLEYWVDADKAHYTTMSITDNAASFVLDASDMTEGTHTLYYRVQDNEGEWSYLHSWDFFVKRIVTNETIEVTSLEYWVDADKAHYTTMSITDNAASFVLDASDMTEGTHTLYYRVQDNEGEWSYLHSWQFFVVRHVTNEEIKVTTVEYWVDTDRDNTRTMTVADDAVSFVLDASTMRQGLHTLYYRFKDNENVWSYLRTWQFFVVRLRQHETPSVIQCEYWIDNFDNKQTVDVTEPTAIFSINAVGMKSGEHTLYYRFKDNEGEYGPLYVHSFIKINPYDPIMILPYNTTELDADMQTANPDYMAYPTNLEEQIPEVECNNPE